MRIGKGYSWPCDDTSGTSSDRREKCFCWLLRHLPDKIRVHTKLSKQGKKSSQCSDKKEEAHLLLGKITDEDHQDYIPNDLVEEVREECQK
jgi:hypothetical protein